MIEFTKEELVCIEFCLEQQIGVCNDALSHDKELINVGFEGLKKDILKATIISKEFCEKLLTKICKHQSK